MKTAYEWDKFIHHDKTITIYKGDNDLDLLSVYSEPYFLAKEIANILGKSKKEMLGILSGHKKVKAKRILKGQKCLFLTKEGFEICLSFNQLSWEIDLKFAALAHLEKKQNSLEFDEYLKNALSLPDERLEKVFSKEECTLIRDYRNESERHLKIAKEAFNGTIKEMEFIIENSTQVCEDAKMVINYFVDARENITLLPNYIAFVDQITPFIQKVRKNLDELEKHSNRYIEAKNKNNIK